MSTKSYNFKNLVFEGGGVKGIAYIGALKVLEEKGILKNIERIAGTSAGAITAALLSVGFTSEEIKKSLGKVNFLDFKDDSFFLINILRLLKKYGWYKGNVFEKWLKKTISKKVSPDITFSQLNSLKGKKNIRSLYVIGTDVNYKAHVVLSNETVPDMPIAEAVRISMSIPLFFKSVKYRNSIYVDGGVYYNYPLNLFDQEKYLVEKPEKNNNEPYNKETLGLRVDSPEEITSQIKNEPNPNLQINSLKNYIQALIGGLVDMANKTHLREKDWDRTVYIDSLGVSSTQFDLSDKQKKELILSGETSARKYFSWFDKSKGADKPLNK